MPPAPLTTALLAGATGTIGLVHLALDPAPFGTDRALVVGSGMAITTLVVISGILLSRGRWSRWALVAVGIAWILLGARNDLDPAAVATVAGGAAMLTAGSGPWLPRWLRHRPSSDGPPPAAVLLLLSLVALPTLLGALGTPSTVALWSGAAWSLGLAIGVSRASAVALWAGRLLHPLVIAAVGLTMELPGALVFVAAGGFQTVLLWRRDVHLSVSPLVPEAATAVPIPRELVDPAVMRAAGLDEDGQPLESR